MDNNIGPKIKIIDDTSKKEVKKNDILKIHIGEQAPDIKIIKGSSQKATPYGGQIDELVKPDHPLLKTKLEEYDFKNPLLMSSEELQRRLILALAHYKGYGLSANQIGLPYRCFVAGNDDLGMEAFFNPKITQVSTDVTALEEGCLTYPCLYLRIKRPNRVAIEWKNVHGDYRKGNFVGLTARILQHEMDHLNGILFTSYATPFELRRAREQQEKILKKLHREKQRK